MSIQIINSWGCTENISWLSFSLFILVREEVRIPYRPIKRISVSMMVSSRICLGPYNVQEISGKCSRNCDCLSLCCVYSVGKHRAMWRSDTLNNCKREHGSYMWTLLFVNGLNSFNAFLVWLTTESALQHQPAFKQRHTHSQGDVLRRCVMWLRYQYQYQYP